MCFIVLHTLESCVAPGSVSIFCICIHEPHTHTPPQVMVNSEVSGVAFSRHPLKPLSANCVLVEAVYGLGEGLVSGELEADRYEVRGEGLVSGELEADRYEVRGELEVSW